MTVSQGGTQLQLEGLQWYPVTVRGVEGRARKCEVSYTNPVRSSSHKHKWESLRGGWVWCIGCVAALQPILGNDYIYHGGECR